MGTTRRHVSGSGQPTRTTPRGGQPARRIGRIPFVYTHIAIRKRRAGCAKCHESTVATATVQIYITAPLLLPTTPVHVWQAESAAGLSQNGKEDTLEDCLGEPADPKLVAVLQEMKEVCLSETTFAQHAHVRARRNVQARCLFCQGSVCAAEVLHVRARRC